MPENAPATPAPIALDRAVLAYGKHCGPFIFRPPGPSPAFGPGVDAFTGSSSSRIDHFRASSWRRKVLLAYACLRRTCTRQWPDLSLVVAAIACAPRVHWEGVEGRNWVHKGVHTARSCF